METAFAGEVAQRPGGIHAAPAGLTSVVEGQTAMQAHAAAQHLGGVRDRAVGGGNRPILTTYNIH